MKLLLVGLLLGLFLVGSAAEFGQTETPVSSRDRVYTAEQTSNTVSVIDPSSNKLLGLIRLGDPVPTALSPLYQGALLVDGLGFSPDSKTLAVVSVGFGLGDIDRGGDKQNQKHDLYRALAA